MKTYTITEVAKIKSVSRQAVDLKAKRLGLGTIESGVLRLSRNEINKLHFREPNK